jgi:endonuclease/exonuclease/phosphatase (EEP) superfamily protein YafD
MLNRLLVVAIIGGVLPLAAKLAWPFELVSHFRLQYLVVALLLLVPALLRRRRRLAAALVACLALNAWPLLPYLPDRTVPAPGVDFSVLNLNANASNAEHDRILERIRTAAADIVTLIELSPEFAARLSELAPLYPYRLTVPANDNFGLAVLSRRPLTDAVPFALDPTRAIRAGIDLPGGGLTLLAVHLVPPMSASAAATRNHQLVALAALTATVTGPLLLCGDFNLTPYSPFFTDFESAAGLTAARRGNGIGISWPRQLPLLGIPIDHCFTRGPLAATNVETMEQTGSDHYPVRVILRRLEPQ